MNRLFFSFVTTFILINSLEARDNPFDPTQTYKDEIAKILKDDKDYPYEYQAEDTKDEYVEEEEAKSIPLKDDKIVIEEVPQPKEQMIVKKEQSMTESKNDKLKVKEKTETTLVKKEEIPKVVEKVAPKKDEIKEDTPKKSDIKKEEIKVQQIQKTKDEEIVFVKKREDVIDSKRANAIKNEEIVFAESPLKVYKPLDFLTIEEEGIRLSILTKYKVYKKFDLENKNKIIFDYHANLDFPTQRVDLKSPIFEKVTIGNHKKDKFFRVVVELRDKPSLYNVTYSNNVVNIVKK